MSHRAYTIKVERVDDGRRPRLVVLPLPVRERERVRGWRRLARRLGSFPTIQA